MIKRVLSYNQVCYLQQSFPVFIRDRNDVYWFYSDVNDEANQELVAFYSLKTANCCPDFDW